MVNRDESCGGDAPPATVNPANPVAERHWLAGLRIVGLLTLGSRVLGLARDVLMAAVFGNGAVMDAFSVAFRIPNLARRLFGEGALSTAFLPAFVREEQQNGLESAWRLAGTMFVALAGVLTAVVLLGEFLLAAAALWWAGTAESQLLILLTAVMLPYLVLICLAAQFSAVLHARDHFTWPALLPVVLNVVWIAALLLVIPGFESPEESLCFCGTGSGFRRNLPPTSRRFPAWCVPCCRYWWACPSPRSTPWPTA
jgi:putative peptidoglycan lipid II flippase